MSLWLRTSLAAVVVFMLCPCVHGQRIVEAEPLGVIKKRGWVIPHLRNFRDRGRVPVTSVGAGGTHTLYATESDLPEGGGVLLWDAAYYRVEGSRRSLIDSPVAAKSIVRLDVGGEVFGYIAYGTGVAITELRPRRAESQFFSLGCEMGYAYYDLNGDGRFELLARSNLLREADIYVPSWVLRGPKKVSR